jgi:AAA+ superfamily predicted ATPase
MSPPDDLSTFARTFKRFLDDVIENLPKPPNEVARMLLEHFGGETPPVLVETLPTYSSPDLQAALEARLGREGVLHTLHGLTVDPTADDALSLASLASGQGVALGPVEYVRVPIGVDEYAICVQLGLYLVGEGPLAILVRRREDWRAELRVEVMGAREKGNRFLGDLRTAMRARSVYRGRVISLALTPMQHVTVHHHKVPSLTADQVILPEGLRERIERHTVGFAEKSAALTRAKRHLKRGLLLYGPPGTGKTLTAMYLASRMKGRTVLLLNGRGLGLVEQACAMARALQPSTVLIEDVDLVAEERTRTSACNTPILFELLNQMDGIGEDADVLFVLTTNRADLLEPALAARPGRVDQAVEIPLPDDDCRRRLLELYARGIDLRIDDRELLVARTRGASAAFMRELLRRAVLIASDDGREGVVEQRDVDGALHELVTAGGPLTRSLLGAGEVSA